MGEQSLNHGKDFVSRYPLSLARWKSAFQGRLSWSESWDLEFIYQTGFPEMTPPLAPCTLIFPPIVVKRDVFLTWFAII